MADAPGPVPDLLEAATRRSAMQARAVAESLTLPVGLTPKDAVWRLGPVTLWRYRPTRPAAERHPVPLLLVYALINKPYIFDLRPERSFIAYLLDQGFDVWLLDWGTPGPEDNATTFDDYATEYLPRAVRRLQKTTGSEAFGLLGYCIGAVHTTLCAALNPEADLRYLALVTPPIDFSDPNSSTFSRWLRADRFDVDRVVDAIGLIPASLIETGSKWARPVDNYVGTYQGLDARLDRPQARVMWQALHRWVHDGVPFAGEAFRQWVKEYVQQNELARGVHVAAGQRVDLKQITAPLLVVAAEYDHIVPLAQATPVLDLVGSTDTRLEVVRGGHVGIMAGSAGPKRLWPLLSEWLAERS
ncbi:MAG: alpha/beta fold hydrolase, partial [Bacteroidota bacterium]